MEPFYGGLNGQSFTVKKVFHSKKELDADLAEGWQSSISVGEFVLISYGMPNDKSAYQKDVEEITPGTYWSYVNLDLTRSKLTYNSTLWQKTYTEGNNHSINGLDYKLLASMTGNTPLIEMACNVIKADGKIDFVYDNSVIDHPKVTFTFPTPYKWYFDTDHVGEKKAVRIDNTGKTTIKTVSPGSGAKVELWRKSSDKEQEITRTSAGKMAVNKSATGLEDELALVLEVPNAWEFVAQEQDITPQSSPTVTLGDYTATHKLLSFELPRAQLFTFLLGTTEEGKQLSGITNNNGYVAANHDPVVLTLGDTPSSIDNNPQKIKDTKNYRYYLPKAYQLAFATTPVAANQQLAIVDLNGVMSDKDKDGLDETKTWTLLLPKTWNFNIGYTPLDATKSPTFVSLDDTASSTNDGLIDTKNWLLKLPKAWNLQLTSKWQNAEKGPSLSAPNDSKGTDGLIDTRTWTLTLPRAWNLKMTSDVINPNLSPYIQETEALIVRGTENSTNTTDTKTWTVHIPKAWDLSLTSELLDANLSPQLLRQDENNASIKKWLLKLPKAWNLLLNPKWQNADANPSITPQSDSKSVGSTFIDTKNWDIALPRAWELYVDALGENPNYVGSYITGGEPVRGDNTHPDSKSWTIHIPKAWKLEVSKGDTLGPGVEPTVREKGSDNETKRYLVDLPRAAKFYYGEGFLGGVDENHTPIDYLSVLDSSFEGYAVGDYYIDKPTGFIYLVSEKPAATTVSFTFVACLLTPKPTINIHGIAPYRLDNTSGEYVPAEPTLGRTEDLTSWALDLGLPHVPDNITTPATFIGEVDKGKVEFTRKGENAAEFAFTIPSGSKIYSGLEITLSSDPGSVSVNGNSVDVKNGDVYINTDSGKVYTWNASTNKWEIAKGALKGPVGDSLKKVDSIHIETTELLSEDLLLNMATEAWFSMEDENTHERVHTEPPKDDEIVDVKWIYLDVRSEDTIIRAYWLHHIVGDSATLNPGWHLDPLTGSAGNLFLHEYEPKGSSYEGYDATYINSLIRNVLDIDNPETLTYSKKTLESIWGWGTWDNNGICYDNQGNVMRFIVPIGTKYYSDLAVTTYVGMTSTLQYANQVDTISGFIEINDTTYYVKREDMVSGHLYDDATTYSAKEIDYLLAWGTFPGLTKS